MFSGSGFVLQVISVVPLGRGTRHCVITAGIPAHSSDNFDNVLSEWQGRPFGCQSVFAVRGVRAGGASDTVFCDGLSALRCSLLQAMCTKHRK